MGIVQVVETRRCGTQPGRGDEGCGETDDVSGALPEPKTLRVIPDADHMLHGYEQVVADHVTGFLVSSVL